MVGRTILHYQILEQLGAGGMGEIYRAQDTRLNRVVALKALTRETPDDDSRRRFIQEAQAASSLNHPNIITIHDIVSLDDAQFMIMEFVDGKTLGELLPAGGLGVSTTLQYGLQIAAGLTAAHAVGIVHRDLKPGNIMVTREGLVKILDFGLAKLTTPAGPVSLSDVTQSVVPAALTVKGSIVGTVSYMSPEQAQGLNVDARSDVFAFGCVLYEMITGRKAFPADSPLLTLTAILRDEPQPVESIVPGVPPELARLIHRALRKDPAQRWQSMQDMHRELLLLKQRLDSAAFAAPAGIPPVKPKLARGAMAAVAFVLLLCIMAGVWWWTGRSAPKTVPPPEPLPAAANATALPKPSAFSPPILNNQAIIEMEQAHVPESVILGQIRSSATAFDLSTAQIIRLTKAGATEAVIHAMRDPAGSATSAPQVHTVQIIGGVPFEIALLEDVPADCQPGQALHFKVTKDVSMGDTVVVAKGAPVTGVVSEAARKKFLVHTTRPTFRLLDVAAVDGSKLRVRASAGHLGESRKDPPLEPLGGLRAKDAVVLAGSRFLAYFDGDQTLTLHQP